MWALPCGRADASCKEVEIWKERRLNCFCPCYASVEQPAEASEYQQSSFGHRYIFYITTKHLCSLAVYTHNHWNLGRLWRVHLRRRFSGSSWWLNSAATAASGETNWRKVFFYFIATLKSACLHPNCVALSLSSGVSSYSFAAAGGREEWPQCNPTVGVLFSFVTENELYVASAAGEGAVASKKIYVFPHFPSFKQQPLQNKVLIETKGICFGRRSFEVYRSKSALVSRKSAVVFLWIMLLFFF